MATKQIVHLFCYLPKAHLAYANQVIACANGSLGAQLPHLKPKFRTEWEQPLPVQFCGCTDHYTQHGKISPWSLFPPMASCCLHWWYLLKSSKPDVFSGHKQLVAFCHGNRVNICVKPSCVCKLHLISSRQGSSPLTSGFRWHSIS